MMHELLILTWSLAMLFFGIVIGVAIIKQTPLNITFVKAPSQPKKVDVCVARGTVIIGTAGEAIAPGDAVILDTNNSMIWKSRESFKRKEKR